MFFFHALVVTFVLNGADVSGRRFVRAGIIQGLVATLLLAKPPVQGGSAGKLGFIYCLLLTI